MAVTIGPDGKHCKACTQLDQLRSFAKSQTKSQQQAAGPAQVVDDPASCPPDIDQLGRATWTFLHTAAAYYPDKPTPQHRTHMLGLLKSLPSLYPCSDCASHLGDEMGRNPPNVSSRSALSQWLCSTHNEVNTRLGKPVFDCSRTDERWRDGPADGSCD